MRGFFAFGLANDFSLELQRAIQDCPTNFGLKPLLPADYHVTIKFLSEFSSTDFFTCLEDISSLGSPPGKPLRAGKLALWPTVFTLECEPTAELIAWHGQVNALLERKGFLRERHPAFRPHVTLARRKAGASLLEVETHLGKVADQFCGRMVSLTPPMLWRSEHEESGRRHRPLLSLWRG